MQTIHRPVRIPMPRPRNSSRKILLCPAVARCPPSSLVQPLVIQPDARSLSTRRARCRGSLATEKARSARAELTLAGGSKRRTTGPVRGSTDGLQQRAGGDRRERRVVKSDGRRRASFAGKRGARVAPVAHRRSCERRCPRVFWRRAVHGTWGLDLGASRQAQEFSLAWRKRYVFHVVGRADEGE